MSEINRNDELKHWGVLGMKWGVRKSKKQLAKEANKKKAENETESFKTSKKKSISKLSDDEIRTEIGRRRLETDLQRQKDDELFTQIRHLELEKRYAELNPPKVSFGKKIFDKVWPTIEKNTLEAGGTLLKEGLLKKGRELLGLSNNDIDYIKETQKLDYEKKLHEKKTGWGKGDSNDNKPDSDGGNNNKPKPNGDGGGDTSTAKTNALDAIKNRFKNSTVKPSDLDSYRNARDKKPTSDDTPDTTDRTRLLGGVKKRNDDTSETLNSGKDARNKRVGDIDDSRAEMLNAGKDARNKRVGERNTPDSDRDSYREPTNTSRYDIGDDYEFYDGKPRTNVNSSTTKALGTASLTTTNSGRGDLVTTTNRPVSDSYSESRNLTSTSSSKKSLDYNPSSDTTPTTKALDYKPSSKKTTSDDTGRDEMIISKPGQYERVMEDLDYARKAANKPSSKKTTTSTDSGGWTTSSDIKNYYKKNVNNFSDEEKKRMDTWMAFLNQFDK